MTALVSILVPSFNHARFLDACIGSIRAQTMSDWEAIAVDDASTDNSMERLNELKGGNLKVLRNATNLGTYGSLESARRLCRGRYIAILNSDDVWLPTKLEEQVSLLDRTPECCFCYTLGEQIDESGAPASLGDSLQGHWPKAEIHELLPKLLATNRVLASSVLFRSEQCRFDASLRYSGDWAALLCPSKQGPAALVSKNMTKWRMHGQNTFRQSPGQVAEEVRLRESILAFGDRWKVPRFSSHDIRSGLAENAVHLAALYVLQGRRSEARQAAKTAVRLHPSTLSIRRLAAVSFPLEVARKRLWGTEKSVPIEPTGPPVEFPC